MRKGTAATSGERGGPTRLGSNRQHRLSACSCVPAAARPVALPAASAPSRHHRCSSALTPLSSPTIPALVDHPRSPPRRPRCPRCSSVPTPLSPTILALLHVISAPRRTSAAPQTHPTDIDPSTFLAADAPIGLVSPPQAVPFSCCGVDRGETSEDLPSNASPLPPYACCGVDRGELVGRLEVGSDTFA